MNRLAFKLFGRDWRSGELTLLTVSLIVAISTMTSISLFTDRIKHSIVEQASQVLAADVQVRGNIAPLNTWMAQAQKQGLSTAMATSISVIAFAGDNMKLSSVKAVTSSYPLKGELEIADRPFGDPRMVRVGPEVGEVWINSGLFSVLNIQVGSVIDVGDRSLLVSAALIKEPDVSMGALFSGARILMNDKDLASTGAVQPGSRVRYQWMLAGAKNEISTFKEWLKPQMGVHHWWVSAKSSSNNLSGTIDRAQSFLLLAGSLSVILAGIAVALAARRYAFKQRKSVALLKTLGLTPQKITHLYVVYLLLLGVIASAVGMLVGWALHWGILYFLKDMLPAVLQPASIKSYWSGAGTGSVALLAFAGPPLFVLRFIPPIIVIRDVMMKRTSQLVVSSLIGVATILSMVYWHSQSAMISGLLLGVLLACMLGVGGLAWVLVYFAKAAGKTMQGYWRLGFSNLYRHRQYNILQIMIFTILLMLLFVLILVRTSLINNWQKNMPDNAPNYFIYNIFSDEKEGLVEFFKTNDIRSQPFYPIVQGRISAVNGIEFKWLKGNPNGKNQYVRELGLTWADTVARSNSVVEGLWWDGLEEVTTSTNQYVSIEKTFAEGMGLVIGDKITMSLSGEEFVTEVASIRSVEWASTNPNFYMVFKSPILGGVGANWITSFYIDPSNVTAINKLARGFPTVTLLAVEQILKQINTIISQVSMAIEFILLLVLVAGLLVLITGIQATLDERLKESAILRTLGANRKLIHRSLLIEFSGLGLVAGVLATLGAELCLALLQAKIFSMPFQMNGWLLIAGPLTGAVLIAAIGWLSTRRVTQTPPLLVLKGLDSRA